MQQVNYKNCNTLQDVADVTLFGLSAVYHQAFPEYIRRIPYFLKLCTSYRELGTNQGGSASVAVLQNLKYYELIDRSFKNFNTVKKHFDTFSKQNNIEICYHEMSSLDVKTSIQTDFLLVDSVHKYEHVSKEIKLYEPLTKKYMMFHDTFGFPGVGKAVKDFLKENNNWKIVEEQNETPGYMILERIL